MKKKIFFVHIVMLCIFALTFAETPRKKAPLIMQVDQKQFFEHFDTSSFPDKIAYKGEGLAIIDFYADWCGPCHKLSAMFKRLVREYNGKVHVYKINVDEEDYLTSTFNASVLPYIVFVPKDSVPRVLRGCPPYKELNKVISSLLTIK